MKRIFQDRREAGRVLAAALLSRSTVGSEPVVLALPRGGVPVAFEIAECLGAPLDVCVVRRLEVPANQGTVVGAVASGQVLVLERSAILALSVSQKDLVRLVRKETRAISRCENAYRGDRPAVRVTGRTVILVDDGLAAIETLMTAIAAIRASMPARLVVALPVAAGSSYRKLLGLVDDVVCLELPTPFQDVGSCYADFSEVSDLDVRRLHTAASERLQRRPVLN